MHTPVYPIQTLVVVSFVLQPQVFVTDLHIY